MSCLCVRPERAPQPAKTPTVAGSIASEPIGSTQAATPNDTTKTASTWR